MTHPLTQETCGTLSRHGWLGFDSDPKGLIHDMRAAADWQLEQVIEWLNEAIFEQSTCFGIESLPEELAKAMRPQEDN